MSEDELQEVNEATELVDDNMELIDRTELHNLRYNFQMLQQAITNYEAELLSAKESAATVAVRVNVLEEQRNSLTEQLTQANINRKIEHHNTIQNANQAITNEQQNANIKYAALHQQHVATVAELEELKKSFGEIKHRQKQAESKLADLPSIQDHLKQANASFDELHNAATWFLNVSANFNGNIEKTLGRSLTISDIRASYLLFPNLKTGEGKISTKILKEIFNI